MAVNKVIYYGEVLVDMSQVTVTPETLAAGKTALNAAGELITGTAEQGGAEPVLQSKNVTAKKNEWLYVHPDEGYDGLSMVAVKPPEFNLNSLVVTPSSDDKVFTPFAESDGFYDVTVKGDANLVPDNIVSGVSIFGVEGAAETGDGGGGSAGNGQGLCTVNIDALADYHIWAANINGTDCYTGVENKVLCSNINTFCIMGVEASGVNFYIEYGDYQEMWSASPFSANGSITYGVFEGLEEGAYVTVTLVVE